MCIRDSGTSVREEPLNRHGWVYDSSLGMGGYSTTDTNDDAYERITAVGGAQLLTDRLVGLGVAPEAAQHEVALFEVVTSVVAKTEAHA